MGSCTIHLTPGPLAPLGLPPLVPHLIPKARGPAFSECPPHLCLPRFLCQLGQEAFPDHPPAMLSEECWRGPLCPPQDAALRGWPAGPWSTLPTGQELCYGQLCVPHKALTDDLLCARRGDSYGRCPHPAWSSLPNSRPVQPMPFACHSSIWMARGQLHLSNHKPSS